MGQGPLPPPAGSHPERTRFLAYRFGGVYGPLCESLVQKFPSTDAPQKPPSGSAWVHAIKHDGYRLMARRDDATAIGSLRSVGFEGSMVWAKNVNPADNGRQTT